MHDCSLEVFVLEYVFLFFGMFFDEKYIHNFLLLLFYSWKHKSTLNYKGCLFPYGLIKLIGMQNVSFIVNIKG